MTFLVISQAVPRETLDALEGQMERLSWRDGKLTAGKTAKRVKENEQADLSSPAGQAVKSAISEALKGHPVFRAAAQPRRFSNLILSRTSGGGHYGAHVDNALMGAGEKRIRTDLSFTLFLSDPETYEGGELTVHLAGARQSFKGERGDLVLYGSSYIHEVAPVTSGERLVCVGWVESLVADETQRNMLFDLENLRASLRGQLPEGSGEMLTLDKTIANLLRMWARP